MGTIKMKVEPERAAISQSDHHDFTILTKLQGIITDPSKAHRQPVDLIAVLDVSGSMGKGSRLSLLKKSMNFIIQNLNPSDRLSIISFSKKATLVLPLCVMSPRNQTLAIGRVKSLKPDDTTNIGAGLREAVEVFEEDKIRNKAVGSIILFSDGKDNHTLKGKSLKDYDLLIPSSILHRKGGSGYVPIHTFGFGSDHDANALCKIAERSGGTFSFIESEDKIQDSFALCVGGLISVVAKNIRLKVKCMSGVRLSSVESGGYAVQKLDDNARIIYAGDLYVDEERCFMVRVHVPEVRSSRNERTELLKVTCKYSDTVSSVTGSNSTRTEAQVVSVERPTSLPSSQRRSIDLDSERIRLKVKEALESARDYADSGSFGEAVEELARANELTKSTSPSPQMTRLSKMLQQMQKNVAKKETYEGSGRPYLMSELCSHSSQRKASSSGSFGSNSSMILMVNRSRGQVPR
ncbi:hypothetical protein LUZ60_006655 [Juncus effusus]|nr:hypothetical protein LUZ60_006655 [Juncus effusus]